jgi:isopentenyl diphosphate isomerase/L-lactate dehydrogenase-like FMN-dependent dehydrogenase
MIISGNHSFPIDQIGAAAKAPMWYQLYPQQAFDENLAILDAAQTAGASTIVVTIDQMASYYERDVHDRHLGNTRLATMAGSNRPRGRTPAAPRNPYRVAEGRLWYNWPFVDKLRPTVKVPMLAKGVLTAEDAKLCVEHGFDGVYVSNHGGRSQDCCPSTLEVLAEVADAVQGRIPVLFDSGVRRGSDVLKALALGAKAVCLGRVPRWGLAAYGAPGVQRILEIMQAELVLAMAATGRPSLASIDRSLVRTEFA